MPHAAGKLWLKMFSTKSMHERNGRIDKGRFDNLAFRDNEELLAHIERVGKSIFRRQG
jgi:hypothetical protein